jgi:uncharacterized protein (DUF1015 family)
VQPDDRVLEESSVGYTTDAGMAVSLVDRGSYEVAFFLNATKITQVEEMAKRGERMPQKSTYFYPKIASGLVVNMLGV